jgi:HK97 gp10 family phage protein
MARFRVSLRGIFVDRKETAAQVQPIMRRVLHKLTRRTSELAKEKAPVKTGRLKASVHEEADRLRGEMTVTGGVSADTPYALFVHQGTRPHLIRATHATSLRFFWPRTQRVEHFKYVHHPGTKPRPFLRDAAETAAATDSDIKHD